MRRAPRTPRLRVPLLIGVPLFPVPQTTSNNVQSIIESRVEKRTKGVYVPMGGKSMITFMDDLNMPAKDTFGSQPPLELLRLWLDYGFWYDRTKQTIKHIKVRPCCTGRAGPTCGAPPHTRSPGPAARLPACQGGFVGFFFPGASPAH